MDDGFSVLAKCGEKQSFDAFFDSVPPKGGTCTKCRWNMCCPGIEKNCWMDGFPVKVELFQWIKMKNWQQKKKGDIEMDLNYNEGYF